MNTQGLHIALGIDVQVVPASGNAAAHIFRIVLEVHREDGLALAELPNPVVYLFPLLRGRQQLGGRVIAHRHIVEEPDKQGAAVNDVVKERLAGNIRIVPAGIAGGDAEGEMMLLQQSHGLLDLLIYALPPTESLASSKPSREMAGTKFFTRSIS